MRRRRRTDELDQIHHLRAGILDNKYFAHVLLIFEQICEQARGIVTRMQLARFVGVRGQHGRQFRATANSQQHYGPQ